MAKTETKGRAAAARTVGKVDYESLYDAFLLLKSRDECARFMRDLCTPAELQAFAERWRVVQILDRSDDSYQTIHAKTGVSITTIGRVARFLLQEPYQGYRTILDRLKNKAYSKHF
ncbi:MAG: TrpR like protein, YerC/YecD [Alphaproteobacteria bacterium]|nr:TrpR like protein, YerC/YecD [Alphaproteobacteria bacterium]MBV8548768.1 TrpR like protein, YerC/YecD [Alphaproteobacteria bacterium]